MVYATVPTTFFPSFLHIWSLYWGGCARRAFCLTILFLPRQLKLTFVFILFSIFCTDGALTGLSKKMIRQLYGDDQFKKWRRGYNEPPPAISSFSSACKCGFCFFWMVISKCFFWKLNGHGRSSAHFNAPLSFLTTCSNFFLPPFCYFYHTDPGNDIRYVKYVSDMPISWFESIIRSLAHGQVCKVCPYAVLLVLILDF